MTLRAKPVSNRPPVPVFVSFGLKPWHTDALCAGHPTPDIFYTKADWPEAKEFCRGCPASIACYEEFASDPHCVAGGTTPDERVHSRRQAARARRTWLTFLDDGEWHSWASVVQHIIDQSHVRPDTARSAVYRALKQGRCEQAGDYDPQREQADQRRLRKIA